MKTLLSLFAFGLTFAIAGPAFADKPAPTTKAECEKAQDFEWDESQNKCVEQSPGG